MTTTWYVDENATAGANNGTTKTDAWLSLASAINGGVTAANDIIWISHVHDEQLGAAATYTLGANHTPDAPLKIISVNFSNDTYTPGALIGHSSSSRAITFANAADSGLALFGVQLKTAGSTSNTHISFFAGGAYNAFVFLYECDIGGLNTSSSSLIRFGFMSSTSYLGATTRLIAQKSTFSYGNTAQFLSLRNGVFDFIDCDMDAGSTHPTDLVIPSSGFSSVSFAGCDLSDIATICKYGSTGWAHVSVDRCKMKTGYALLGSGVTPNYRAVLYDSSDGDTHYHIGYADYRGTLAVDTGIYCNDAITDTPLSWKIVTTAAASQYTPFVTPWFSQDHTGTSAITPYLECLRSGSSTAYTNAQVWSEWAYKGTSGSTKAAIGNDGALPLAAGDPQDNSSKGASDWTGENATSWFGKLGPDASFTPAEAGAISFRICVGAPSATVYVDPQIRGLS